MSRAITRREQEEEAMKAEVAFYGTVVQTRGPVRVSDLDLSGADLSSSKRPDGWNELLRLARP